VVSLSPVDGKVEVFYTIKLTNASVSNIRKYIDLPGTAGHNFHELEEISFTFQKIEIESKSGKTMAMDDWSVGNK
jgi:type VI secretion system Hcp family effector